MYPDQTNAKTRSGQTRCGAVQRNACSGVAKAQIAANATIPKTHGPCPKKKRSTEREKETTRRLCQVTKIPTISTTGTKLILRVPAATRRKVKRWDVMSETMHPRKNARKRGRVTDLQRASSLGHRASVA